MMSKVYSFESYVGFIAEKSSVVLFAVICINVSGRVGRP